MNIRQLLLVLSLAAIPGSSQAAFLGVNLDDREIVLPDDEAEVNVIFGSDFD